MHKLALLILVVAGCSSSGSEYADLYDAPTVAATNTMFGTWGGLVDPGFDTRWVFSPNSLTIANKCGSRIVGIDVAAEVTETTIRILQSDQAGNDSCFVRSAPGSFTVCSSDPFTPKDNCFIHDQRSLKIFEDSFERVSLSKLSDAQ